MKYSIITVNDELGDMEKETLLDCFNPACFLAISIEVKLSLKQAVEAHRVVRLRGSHIFWTIDSQMAVRLSALHVRRPLLPTKIPGTYFY
jgi:hypothetical protein